MEYETILSGENNDSGSTFIYELDEPMSPRFLRFTMIDKFPDDGQEWTRNTITFDELSAGYCVPGLDELTPN